MSVPPTGFDAMGKPISPERMQSAYVAVKEMMPNINTEDAMTLVGRVANALERDEPYEALKLATDDPIERGLASLPAKSDHPPVHLDLTGGYRLLAHLLT